MERPRTKKEKIAKIVRAATVPPAMVLLFVIVLAAGRAGYFETWGQGLLTLLFLGILPVAAYPLSYIIPSLRKKGRDGQRNLAFALSVVGYVGAWVYGILLTQNRHLVFLYTVYLLSVAFLILANRVFRLKASGHACSVAGPLLVCGLSFGALAWVVGGLIYLASLWSSLVLKRHTVGEFLLGTVLCMAAAGLAWIFCFGI